jgi:hypothetical protein
MEQKEKTVGYEKLPVRFASGYFERKIKIETVIPLTQLLSDQGKGPRDPVFNLNFLFLAGKYGR